MKKLSVTAAILATLTTSCASTYNKDLLTPQKSKLSVGSSVVIATPESGAFNGEQYSSSGSMTASVIRSAFSHYSNKVDISANCKTLECLKSSNDSVDYLVVPEILHWEDRATEWSGKPDRIEIKIIVYSNKSNDAISSIILTGKSKWATFGGDHPQDLLPEPVSDYVKSLY